MHGVYQLGGYRTYAVGRGGVGLGLEEAVAAGVGGRRVGRCGM